MTTAECKEVFALLSHYIDGELPDEVCRQMTTHIEGCPPCVDFLKSLEKTVGLCRQMQAKGDPGPLPAEVSLSLKRAYEQFRNAESS